MSGSTFLLPGDSVPSNAGGPERARPERPRPEPPEAAALRALGCEHVFTDIDDDRRIDRPGLRAALDFARLGDVLTVPALGHLGANVETVVRIVASLSQKGVTIRLGGMPMDMMIPTGEALAFACRALEQLTEPGPAPAAPSSGPRRRGRPQSLSNKVSPRPISCSPTAMPFRRWHGRSASPRRRCTASSPAAPRNPGIPTTPRTDRRSGNESRPGKAGRDGNGGTSPGPRVGRELRSAPARRPALLRVAISDATRAGMPGRRTFRTDVNETEVAGGPGFEPGLTESESAVLPLNYPPPWRRERRFPGPSAATHSVGTRRQRQWRAL